MSEEREQRNAVFNSSLPAGVDPRMPVTTAAEKVKKDFGFEIPVESIPLPSMGKVYNESTGLNGLETVDIRAMTAREEDILTSRALLKKGTVITELIKSCLMDKRINPADMLIGDRNALMTAIRITGYGPEYKGEVECAECSTRTGHEFNLGELPIKRLEIDPIDPNTNSFSFMLPVTKKNVVFKFLTGRDEEEIQATAERQKKLALQNGDTGVTTSLLYSIVSIDGITDRAKLGNFVRMMPARDSLALRNYMKDNEPGIEMKQETSCPSCGHRAEVDMPIGVNFLWPSARR